MDLELLLAKNNFTTDDQHFLEDFVRTDENNSLKFGANNDPDLTQFMEDLEGRIIGRQSEISIYCFYSILCLYIVVILIGSMGNILVLIAVFGRKSMRTAHNSFIGILAFSDFILCIIYLPFNLWEMLLQQWPFGPDTEHLCSFVMAVQKMPVFLSSLAIMAIGWDRYRCVFNPDRPQFTLSSAALIICGMLILSLVMSSPLYFMAEIKIVITFKESVQMESEHITTCVEFWTRGWRIAYKTCSCVFQFLGPVILVTYMNCSVVGRLQNRPRSANEDQNNRRKRATRIILAVTTIFVLAWLPLNMFTLISEFHPEMFKVLMGRYHNVMYLILHLLGAANAVSNPILYGYLNENFRHEYFTIYRKMPWYPSSVVMARTLRRSLKRKSTRRKSTLIGNSANNRKNSSLEVIEESSSLTLPPKRLRKFHGKSEIMFSGIKEEISSDSAADGWPIELQEALNIKSVSTNQNPHHQCLLLKNELKNCSEKSSPKKLITFIKHADTVKRKSAVDFPMIMNERIHKRRFSENVQIHGKESHFSLEGLNANDLFEHFSNEKVPKYKTQTSVLTETTDV